MADEYDNDVSHGINLEWNGIYGKIPDDRNNLRDLSSQFQTL